MKVEGKERKYVEKAQRKFEQFALEAERSANLIGAAGFRGMVAACEVLLDGYDVPLHIAEHIIDAGKLVYLTEPVPNA